MYRTKLAISRKCMGNKNACGKHIKGKLSEEHKRKISEGLKYNSNNLTLKGRLIRESQLSKYFFDKYVEEIMSFL
jgi:hypothetical protein